MPLRKLIVWLIAFKAGYFALLMAAVTVWPDFNEAAPVSIKARWFTPSDAEWLEMQETGVARHFTTWDAEHYLVLSEAGYSEGLKSSAFYPLWPLLIRWSAILTGGDHVIAGVILANILSLAGWVLFYVATKRRFGESVAAWALALLIAFPGSLFYQFIYSEPLFFLLLMALWFGLETSRYGLAWAAAFLLPMTRAVGVFSILPIGWLLLEELWRNRTSAAPRMRDVGKGTPAGLNARNADAGKDTPEGGMKHDRRNSRKRVTQLAVLAAAPILGWAAVLGLMWMWTGNPFEGIEAQKYWGAHSISNLWNIPKFAAGFFSPATWHEFRGSVLDRCGFLLLLCCLPLIWRLGKDLAVWTYALGILPAMSGTFVSFIRFESIVFPLFIALAVFFSERKNRWPAIAFLGLSSLLHLALLWRFVNFRWAG